MGIVIAVVGESGSGKTASMLPNKEIGIIGLNPAETVFVSCAGKGKSLSFPGASKVYKVGKLNEGANHIYQTNAEKVATIIRKIGGGIVENEKGEEEIVEPEKSYEHIKNLVIDDAQYLQGFVFMSKVTEKGYDKFSHIGYAGFVALKASADIIKKDLNIIFTYHSEETNKGSRKIKTGGKVVDAILTIEGLFDYVFFTNATFDFATKETKFAFQTRTDGFSTAKTPPGCFKTFEIPNDMHQILKRINEYLETT